MATGASPNNSRPTGTSRDRGCKPTAGTMLAATMPLAAVENGVTDMMDLRAAALHLLAVNGIDGSEDDWENGLLDMATDAEERLFVAAEWVAKYNSVYPRRPTALTILHTARVLRMMTKGWTLGADGGEQE